MRAAVLPLAVALIGGPAAARDKSAAAPLMTPLVAEWQYTGTPFPGNDAAPVMAGDNVFFATGKTVWAVAADSGTLKWRYPLQGQMDASINTSPAYDSGMVFLGAGDGVYALDAATGALKWHFYLKLSVNTSPQIWNGYVYFTADDGRFYELDEKTGNPMSGIWHQGTTPGVPLGSTMQTDFVIQNGTIYYATSDGVLHANNLGGGRELWNRRLNGDLLDAPVIGGEYIYAAAGSTLTAYRIETGRPAWTVNLPIQLAASPAVDGDGNVYVISQDNLIYGINNRGKGIWRQPARVDFQVFAAPIVVGNLLVVGTQGGGVYAFNTADGSIRWSYQVEPSGRDNLHIPMDANINTSPMVANGGLYVFSDDGTLTAFSHDMQDFTPPDIELISPTVGEMINGRPPIEFKAKITDTGSGVDLDTLSLMIDGQKLPRRPATTEVMDKPGFYFDPSDGAITYVTEETNAGLVNGFRDGHHTFTLIATDWSGNTTRKDVSFTTSDLVRKKPRYPHPATAGSSGGRNRNKGGNNNGGA